MNRLTYEAATLLCRQKHQRKLGCHTYLEKVGLPDDVVFNVRYHGNHIARVYKHAVCLYGEGYIHHPTTRSRFRDLFGLRVYRTHVLDMYVVHTSVGTYQFRNGMQVFDAGLVTGSNSFGEDHQLLDKLHDYTNEMIKKLFWGHLETPTMATRDPLLRHTSEVRQRIYDHINRQEYISAIAAPFLGGFPHQLCLWKEDRGLHFPKTKTDRMRLVEKRLMGEAPLSFRQAQGYRETMRRQLLHGLLLMFGFQV